MARPIFAVITERGADSLCLMDEANSSGEARPHYRWPWLVGATVLLAVVIAVLAVRREAQRVKERKELLQQHSGTNAFAPAR